MRKETFRVFGINRHRMKVDGRGVTTLVALAGCPLTCEYCINEAGLAEAGCVEELTAAELVERLAMDHCYFVYTNGGVTFGGGESLLHSAQIEAFSKVCPGEWNITLETSLNVPFEQLEPLLTERFSFIIDVKAMQSEIYKKYTGMDNAQVISNLRELCKRLAKEQYVVKIPVIPGYSTEQEIEESKKLLQELGIPEENIITFTYVTKN